MEEDSVELQEFLNLLEQKEKIVAMLAPSFPIDFSYPEIVGKLKRLGFGFVVEVARGAIETNKGVLAILAENPKARLITSPCPAIVRMIRVRYPHLIKFLAPVSSPMAQTAKICADKYPGHRLVFIGPCPAKKLEAKEDHSDLRILVLTYKELMTVFKRREIKDEPQDFFASFDLIGPKTRLYPISGGLAQSSDFKSFLTDEEYDVVSGPKLVPKTLEEFPKNRLKVLDILFCDGGCINGPGIASPLSLAKRREKVITYWAHTSQID